MSNDDFVLEKDLIINFIFSENCKHNVETSPIRLQKSLYFLFALWGKKFIEQTGESEFEGNFSKYLFDASFHAWKYGPVDKGVYREYKDKFGNYQVKDDVDQKIISEIKVDLKMFLSEIIKEMSTLSDFALVDISHRDVTWVNAFKSKDQSMDCDKIIQEYANRV